MYSMVGMAASMRATSEIGFLNVSSASLFMGTLRSKRHSTRFPLRSMSVMLGTARLAKVRDAAAAGKRVLLRNGLASMVEREKD
jgi:hypothetical protein